MVLPLKMIGHPFEPSKKKRKPFSIGTKKKEWMRASGRDPFGTFVKISRCRVCKTPLRWNDRNYEFDHKDNNSANNNQKNCWLVCLKHHRRATKNKVIKERDILGNVVGHKTIKLKVGYKKSRKKPKKVKGKPKKRQKNNIYGLGDMKLPLFKPSKVRF